MSEQVTITYDDQTVRRFLMASIIWGLIGMLVGLLAATQLAWPEANFGIEWLTFGRMRPLHTNAVIFAFVGNMLFAGVYYSTQRLCKTPTASKGLSNLHFWGWQLIIVGAVLTLPFGITQSKEYAELEWFLDLGVVVIWVAFAVNFFWTLARRREKHLYVALWFYIATIVTVAVLYIVNNIALPISLTKSYPVFAGVQDALVQWWYGHNAVAFFLTTPILGIMYYFLPKAANRPVYSYRLSIIHFWALVFLYIWAGPHHLLYTSLPDWAQDMGMVFSLMLWAPSWGGMLNGLLTLRGAWHLLRTDPVIKFLIAGVTFYGMATFEGPLLSIKAVSALGHYTDWIIGHVHLGALGWNGFMAAGMIYWLVPRLWDTKLYSKKAADAHFWIGTLGILLYAVSMWVAGITEGLMWRAVGDDGGLLYPNFVDTTTTVWPMLLMRIVGGTLYFTGFIILGWNVIKTIRTGKPTNVTVTVTNNMPPKSHKELSWKELAFHPALLLVYIGTAAMLVFFVTDITLAIIFLGLSLLCFLGATAYMGAKDYRTGENVHRMLEGRPFIFTVLTILAILVGGVAELVPTLTIDSAIPRMGKLQTPYTPLELTGRDVYVREGCYNCHSQQIRPFLSEAMRYGAPSEAGESIYNHPFQWGSKRTGPDLAREGSNPAIKKSNLWHYQHLVSPQDMSPGSVMPPYFWLEAKKVDVDDAAVKMRAMKTLGVPYKQRHISRATKYMEIQGKLIADDLATSGIQIDWDSEIIAVISYLQRLGNNPDLPLDDLLPPAEGDAGSDDAAADEGGE